MVPDASRADSANDRDLGAMLCHSERRTASSLCLRFAREIGPRAVLRLHVRRSCALQLSLTSRTRPETATIDGDAAHPRGPFYSDSAECSA